MPFLNDKRRGEAGLDSASPQQSAEMTKLFVLAGNASEFSKYRSKYPKGMKPVYVSRPEDCRTVQHGAAVLVVGSFLERTDANLLVDAMKARGAKLVDFNGKTSER